MDHLRRELAPITDAAWAQIEEEAIRTLQHFLCGRAVVDVTVPHGWAYTAAPTGRTRPAGGNEGGVVESVRSVIPAVELRVPITVAMAEIDAAERGGDAELGAVVEGGGPTP